MQISYLLPYPGCQAHSIFAPSIPPILRGFSWFPFPLIRTYRSSSKELPGKIKRSGEGSNKKSTGKQMEISSRFQLIKQQGVFSDDLLFIIIWIHCLITLVNHHYLRFFCFVRSDYSNNISAS